MKKLVAMLMLFFVLYSNAQPKSKHVDLEKRILDTILSLPEVKEEVKKVEKLSKNTRHLSDVIYRRPSEGFNYYWIKVWEDNGYAYYTHLNFYVNPKTLEIKF